MDLDYLWAAIDPASTKAAPEAPSIQPTTTFSKRIDFGVTWTINDDDLENEKVSTSEGVILWFVSRGTNSAYRMGLVKAGTQSTEGFGSGHGLIMFRPSHTLLAASYLQWDAETAIPYAAKDGSTAGKQIEFSPDLSEQYSSARMTSGVMHVLCDSESITPNIAMTGTFTAATVTDIRAVQQTLQASDGIYRAYHNATLTSHCSSKQDAIFEVRAETGVTTIVGSDLAPMLMAPNVNSHNSLNSETKMFEGTGFYSTGLSYIPLGGEEFVLHCAWISPWHTSIGGAAFTGSGYGAIPGTGVVPQNIQYTSGMNPCGVLDIRASYQPLFNDVFVRVFKVYIVDVFCSVGEKGTLNYYTYMKAQIATMILAPTAVLPYDQLFSTETFVVEHSPKVNSRGLAGKSDNIPFSDQYQVLPVNAMYVGTQMTAVVLCMANGTTDITGIKGCQFSVSARNMYDSGELGPVRIVKYERLLTHQTASVRGIAHVQGIAYGSVVPFVQNTGSNHSAELNLNTIMYMQRLFDSSSSPFHRNWEYPAYLAFIAKGPPSQEQVQQWLQLNQDQVIDRKRKMDASNETGSMFNGARPMLNRTLSGAKIVVSDRLKSMDEMMRLAMPKQPYRGDKSF
jgi:hypothetical protein